MAALNTSGESGVDVIGTNALDFLGPIGKQNCQLVQLVTPSLLGSASPGVKSNGPGDEFELDKHLTYTCITAQAP